MRHLLSISDFKKEEIWDIFSLALRIKKEIKKKGENKPFLKKKSLAMVFEKPSLRTRVSFEVAMTQLGGHALYLGPQDIKMGEREKPFDVAKNLSRMVDFIMARVFRHQILEELAKNSQVPVINGLSDLEHPCQALADLFTVYEKKKKLAKLTLAFVGDGENNVAHSLALLSAMLGVNFRCGAPKGYWMLPKIVRKINSLAEESGAEILETASPREAVRGADIVVTDTWVSMGDEEERKKRLKVFPPYQVNRKLLALAKKKAVFLHCLPAYRGYEVTSSVIDGSQSLVYDEAENRLHIQKALLVWIGKRNAIKEKL